MAFLALIAITIMKKMNRMPVEDNKVLYRLTKMAEFVVEIIRVRISLELS